MNGQSQSASTLRRFCFTLNNYTTEDVAKCEKFINENCKYGIFGRETAPNTGTIHLQGFCSLVKPMRFTTIKKQINNTLHIEKARGSDADNQIYCRKSGDYFEKGEPCYQGKRTDIETCIADIKAGTTDIKEIAEKHPSVYIKYHRGLHNYINLVFPKEPRSFKTEVFYFWGPPGTGKSRRALEEATAAGGGIYYKPRGDWWDGYRQQDNVIIDDFYGWIKYDELLKITDRYPYRVPIKGGYEEFISKKIWITSNVDTDVLYKFVNYSNCAFERRITNKVSFN